MPVHPQRPNSRQSCAPSSFWRTLAAVLVLGATASAQNDDFADRALLQGGAASASASNVGASAQPDEPDHATGQPPSASLWWEWTAPQDGHFEINTETSDFDTVLAVYVGSALTDLEFRASNNDVVTLGTASRVVLLAEEGETYQIAVDGAGGATGNVSLNLFPALLRNDEFGQRLAVSGTSVFDIQSNVGGTIGLYEPNHVAPYDPSASVWWEWTADTDGWVSVDTAGSSFDTVAAVYIRDVILVGNNNDYYRDGEGDDLLHPGDIEDEFNARIRFYATAGNAYQIVVDGSDGLEQGAVHFSIEQDDDHPANDNVVAAHVLESETNGDTTTASYLGDSFGASVELGEPDHNPGDETHASATVWFSWDSPAFDRLVTIDTFDSDFDTVLAVYSREGDVLIRWASNDDDFDFGDFTSSVTFNSTAGTTYLIAVDGYSGEQGEVGLNLVATPQLNDTFDDAVAQFGAEWQAASNNANATGEAGEPPHHPGVPASNSIWFRWESILDGQVSADTVGSNFDTVLAVYTGTLGDPDDPLVQVATDDDTAGGGLSSVSFEVEYGTVYYFAVDGKDDDTGDIRLNFSVLGGYEHWLTQYPALEALMLLPADDPARVGALPDGDPDDDGFPNRLEAAFGLNPLINSQPGGTDPNLGNAPRYSFDGTNVQIDFTIDPVFAQTGDNDESTRLQVYAERSSSGILWSKLTPVPVSGDSYRVTFPVANGEDFGVFRVTASDSTFSE